jgi:hypothetical protein
MPRSTLSQKSTLRARRTAIPATIAKAALQAEDPFGLPPLAEAPAPPPANGAPPPADSGKDR